jgi:hypothetical protein
MRGGKALARRERERESESGGYRRKEATHFLNVESADSQLIYIEFWGGLLDRVEGPLDEKSHVGLIRRSVPAILLVGFVGEGISWGAVLHSMQGIIGFACNKGLRFEVGHRQPTEYEIPFS